ncbi:MAG TPA: hypothetical protein PLN85_01280 [archaeon]|nr:hypothetical protein [archaeon]
MLDSYINKITHTSNPLRKSPSTIVPQRTIFYGTVLDIDDKTDGMRIKVYIPDLDSQIDKDNPENLSWCYPLLPKFFHVYPKINETVRVFIEDISFNQKGRFWLGSIISQPHKIGGDYIFSARSNIDKEMGLAPEKAPSTYPDAEGIYPTKTDVAIIGRVNTDVILRLNEVHIRAGKHENDNPLKLNIKNPAQISLVFEPNIEKKDEYQSNIIMTSDKIALISHDGNPNLKTTKLKFEDRKRIFDNTHPLVRGDVLLEILEIFRNVLINHIHGYSALPAEKTEIIRMLEELQFEPMLQKNIVIN